MQKNRYTYLAGACALLTLAVYLPALGNGFVWDDIVYVSENPAIRRIGSGMFEWAFFRFYASNWHPLTWVSHALDYAAWGLNPPGHHLTNIVLHAANVFLVVILVVRLLESYRKRTRAEDPWSPDERAALIAAGVTGLLFGIHPVHVESVAWVAERKDVLCALFYLSGLIAYAGHAEAREEGAPQFSRHYLATLMLFALALLSKPMAVSLPVVLLILDWRPFGAIRSAKTFRHALIGKLPFIGLSLASSIITVLAQKAQGAMTLMESVRLTTRMMVAGDALVSYLLHMAWPVHLVPYYPYLKNGSLSTAEYAAACGLVVAITVYSVVAVRRGKTWPAFWAFYVVTLLPVLGIVQVGGQSMADRYTYLPGLAPFLAAGLGCARLSEKIGAGVGRTAQRSGAAALAAAVFVLLSFLTVRQTGIWNNSIRLWDYVIEQEPGRVALAYYNRGTVLAEAGRFERAIGDFDEAIALFPRYAEAYNNRGILFSRARLYDKAEQSFSGAIAADPGGADGYVNRGLVYSLTGRYVSALSDFDRAISLAPNHALAYYNRGKLYLASNQRERALADLQTGCKLGYPNSCRAARELYFAATQKREP